MYVCARSNPDVFRVPRKSKKFDELLQTATKKVLQHTVWGTEGRMLFEVDREYLVQMPRPEQRLWQARTRARTHSHTHTFTLTHSHAHTLTHSHTHTTGNEVRSLVPQPQERSYIGEYPVRKGTAVSRRTLAGGPDNGPARPGNFYVRRVQGRALATVRLPSYVWMAVQRTE